MKKLLVLLIACLALTLAACGDDDDDDGGGGSSETTTEQTDTGTAPSGGGGGGTAEVDIPDISFEPKSLTVKAGTTVTWTNSDDVPHTVTKEGGPGGKFDSGPLNPGQSFSYTPTKAGTIQYLCSFHQGMVGTIVVK